MPKPLELPKGQSVLVEVDLRYAGRGSRLDPFLIHYKNERYRILRVTRRQKKIIHEREHMVYHIKIERQREAYDLIQDLKTSMWSLRQAINPR
ncbi:MAG: hypothetical protein DKINENOH_04193 [bacterium]|nr:hypothetical protein [bacterium]MCG3157559.1 hypothetical protein [bacterium]MCK6562279.1 hypothetical protein [bacterium]NUM65188.1 hypothetical protein [candidate division KSB1 bacterium]